MLAGAFFRALVDWDEVNVMHDHRATEPEAMPTRKGQVS